MTRRRRLSSEETALWKSVADKVERLIPERDMSQDHAMEHKKKPLPKGRVTETAPLPSFRLGEKAKSSGSTLDVQPPLRERVNGAALNMDRKAFQKMRRGKLGLEGRIDLHGMTLVRAHPALNRFILSSHQQGKRLVLVITGKGKDRAEWDPISSPRGVLRQQVPQWLSMPPLSSVVLQVTTAHVSHGDDGAYYVYLRKGR